MKMTRYEQLVKVLERVSGGTPNNIKTVMILPEGYIISTHQGVYSERAYRGEWDSGDRGNSGVVKALIKPKVYSSIENLVILGGHKGSVQKELFSGLSEYTEEALCRRFVRLHYLCIADELDTEQMGLVIKAPFAERVMGNSGLDLRYIVGKNPNWYKKTYLRSVIYGKDVEGGKLAAYFEKRGLWGDHLLSQRRSFLILRDFEAKMYQECAPLRCEGVNFVSTRLDKLESQVNFGKSDLSEVFEKEYRRCFRDYCKAIGSVRVLNREIRVLVEKECQQSLTRFKKSGVNGDLVEVLVGVRVKEQTEQELRKLEIFVKEATKELAGVYERVGDIKPTLVEITKQMEGAKHYIHSGLGGIEQLYQSYFDKYIKLLEEAFWGQSWVKLESQRGLDDFKENGVNGQKIREALAQGYKLEQDVELEEIVDYFLREYKKKYYKRYKDTKLLGRYQKISEMRRKGNLTNKVWEQLIFMGLDRLWSSTYDDNNLYGYYLLRSKKQTGELKKVGIKGVEKGVLAYVEAHFKDLPLQKVLELLDREKEPNWEVLQFIDGLLS